MAKKEILGPFEQLTLTAITLPGDNAYGATVHQKIEELAGRSYSIGSVYTTMDRLQAKNYVQSWYRGAGEERGQRSKRYFKISGASSRALQRLLQLASGVVSGLRAAGHFIPEAMRSLCLITLFVTISSYAHGSPPPAYAGGPADLGLTSLSRSFPLAYSGLVMLLLVGGPGLYRAFRVRRELSELSRLLLAGRRTRHQTKRPTRPQNGEFLIRLFLPKQEGDAMAGDLQERYTRMRKLFGHRKATIWYWKQVLWSLGPLAGAMLSKLSKIGAVIALIKRISS